MARRATKTPETITEKIGEKMIQVNLPRIPTVGPCKIWGKTEAAEIRKNLTEADAFLSNEHYRRLGEALGDQNARDLQTERQFTEEYEILTQTVRDTMEGRLREIVILGCGRAMLQHFPKSPLGLMHFVNHGIQIGLFRRPNAGEKALTVELPVGTLQRWDWTTLLTPIPGGNDLIGALRPIADAAREKLHQEDLKMTERRLEGLKAQTATFAATMKSGRGRTACHVPALRTAPECWLDLGLNNNQIRVLFVGGGNGFQQSLTGLAIPLAAIEAGRLNFNARTSLGDKLRRAEYLLASLLDALELAGVTRPKPHQPVANTTRPAAKPAPAKPTSAAPSARTAELSKPPVAAAHTFATAAPTTKPEPNPENVVRRERRKGRRARMAAKAAAGSTTPAPMTLAEKLAAARLELSTPPTTTAPTTMPVEVPTVATSATEPAAPEAVPESPAPETPAPATAEPAPFEVTNATGATDQQ